MKRLLGWVAAAALGLWSGQASALEQYPQAWELVTAQGKSGEALLFGELQFRTRLDIPKMDQVLVRGLIGHQLTKHSSLWLGAAWIPNWADKGLDTVVPENEGRFFQQYLYSQSWGKLTFSSRNRLEERLIKLKSLGFRFRSMSRVVYGLLTDDKGVGLSLAAYDEPFVHLYGSKGAPQTGFDQNRAFVGVNYRFSPLVALEGGYMNQIVRNANATYRMGHTSVLWLMFNL